MDVRPGFACLLPARLDPILDELLTKILRETRTIAMVGASPNWNRPSYFAMRYLQRKGFRVIPVNPRALDAPILGEQAYADLASVPVPVDVVDVFRRPTRFRRSPTGSADRREGALAPARDHIRRGAPDRGSRRAHVHPGPCMKIEFGRLSGELSWSGINSGIITSRRRRILV